MLLKNAIFIVFFLSLPLMAETTQEYGVSIRSYFSNDKEGTINKPMTTDTSGKSVDGKSTYTGKITCSGGQSQSFLSVAFQRSALGDITVQAFVDKDLDGKKETTYTTPFEVSGVCTNGVIRCDAGTFSNCYYYKWNYDNTNFGTAQVLRSDMGGCFCINQSCGNPSQTSPGGILETLGGGLTSAIAAANRNYVVTKTQNNGSSIEYWGQNASNCQQAYGSQGLPSFNPTSDFTLAGVDSVTSSQLKDQNSPYSAFQGGVSNASLQLAQNSCEIKNPISLSEKTINYFQYYYVTWKYNNADTESADVTATQDDVMTLYAGKGTGQPLSCSRLTTYVYKQADFSAGSCLNAEGAGAVIKVNAYNTSPITLEAEYRESDHTQKAPFWMTGQAIWKDIVTPQISNATTSTCKSFEDNSSCKLKDEKICDETGQQCVTTLSNFTPQSVTIQPFCKSTSTSTYNWVICQDKDQITYTNSGPKNGTGVISATPGYPLVKRVYQCKYNLDSNISTMQDRYLSVKTTQDGSSFQYTSTITNSDGTTSTESNNGTINFMAPPNAKFCEVQWKDSSRPDVYSDSTNKGQTVAGGATVKSEIRQCQGADYSVCPYDTLKNESIKHPCGNINDFPEVVGELQAVADAAKDMICSQD